ncbi:MAG TPA: helix-turn-helix domain-containing protein [Gemmatimonadaceae bacterium]|jgi:HTH-type transcriptional regulator/antitoxin HipB|nr:helix-turn-helix domain-containing protein [Gemmatimonadaceae bacterium]
MRIRSATELGHLAREARRSQGLTQAQLAARVGASRKWIIDLEGGKRTADLSLVLRTLNILGLDLDVTPRTRSRPSVLDAIVTPRSPSRDA